MPYGSKIQANEILAVNIFTCMVRANFSKYGMRTRNHEKMTGASLRLKQKQKNVKYENNEPQHIPHKV